MPGKEIKLTENNLSHGMEVYKGVTGSDIVIARDPEVVLAEAQRAAAALQNVISKKKNKVVFNNEQYIEFEDWQTLAKFYGCTVKVVPGSTRFVQFGDVVGFEATALAVDRDGNEISCAEAMCLNDEANWGKRSKFSWKNKTDLKQGEETYGEFTDKSGTTKAKVRIGEEQVPLFQLRSMAQTRACAKALRNVFSWVVVLAGYQPTPAEELPGAEHVGQHPNGQAPTPTVRPPQKKTNGATQQSESLPLHNVTNVTEKSGTGAQGPWTKWTITTNQGKYSTFSETFGSAAHFAWESNFPVRLTFKDTGKYGNELLTFEVVEEVQAEPVQESLQPITDSPM